MFAFKKKLLQLNIHGIISEKGEINSSIIDDLEEKLKSASVAGLIIDINSPGGSPVTSHAIYNEVLTQAHKHNKPVFAYISELGASGGYFIAASADVIYGDLSSMVGSIGVRTGSFGFNELIEKIGIERRVFTAGSNKSLNDPFKPVDDVEKKHLESMLNEIHIVFKNSVIKTREKRLQEAFTALQHSGKFAQYKTIFNFYEDYLFSGLVFTGYQAKELGLIDNIATRKEMLRDIEHYFSAKGIKVDIKNIKTLNKKKKNIINILKTEMSLFLKEQILTKGV